MSKKALLYRGRPFRRLERGAHERGAGLFLSRAESDGQDGGESTDKERLRSRGVALAKRFMEQRAGTDGESKKRREYGAALARRRMEEVSGAEK